MALDAGFVRPSAIAIIWTTLATGEAMRADLHLVPVPVPAIRDERDVRISPLVTLPPVLAQTIAAWKLEREAWLLDADGNCVGVLRHERRLPWPDEAPTREWLREPIWRVYRTSGDVDDEVSGEAPMPLEAACQRLLRLCR